MSERRLIAELELERRDDEVHILLPQDDTDGWTTLVYPSVPIMPKRAGIALWEAAAPHREDAVAGGRCPKCGGRIVSVSPGCLGCDTCAHREDGEGDASEAAGLQQPTTRYIYEDRAIRLSHIAANAEIARLREINAELLERQEEDHQHLMETAWENLELSSLLEQAWEREVALLGMLPRLRLLHRLCMSTAPKQAIGETVAEMVKAVERVADDALAAHPAHNEQGEDTADKALAGEMKGSLGDENDASRTGRLTSAPDSSPDGKRVADQSSPTLPVCGWIYVPADKRYPWRTGCGYNTTASPGRWKNKCPFPNCGLPIVTDGEEG